MRFDIAEEFLDQFAGLLPAQANLFGVAVTRITEIGPVKRQVDILVKRRIASNAFESEVPPLKTKDAAVPGGRQ